MTETPKDSDRLVVFLRQHRPVPPSPAPDLEAQIMTAAAVSPHLNQTRGQGEAGTLLNPTDESEGFKQEKPFFVSTTEVGELNPLAATGRHKLLSASPRLPISASSVVKTLNQRRWLIPSAIAASMLIAWVGTSMLMPPKPSAAELASLEAFLENTWEDAEATSVSSDTELDEFDPSKSNNSANNDTDDQRNR
jgi:hypothetical protein